MLNQIQVGPVPSQSLPDGQIYTALSGKAGETIVADLHGKFYTQTYRGNTFIGSTAAAGVALPVYSGTAMTFGLWNPSGNTKNASILYANLGVATVGTPVVATIGLAYTGSAGSAIGTAAPISAFTAGTPVSALLGGGTVSTMKFTPSAATLTTAPTWLMNLGLSQESATAGTGIFSANYAFDGTLVLTPGNAIWFVGTAAPGQTFNVTMVWEEIPV